MASLPQASLPVLGFANGVITSFVPAVVYDIGAMACAIIAFIWKCGGLSFILSYVQQSCPGAPTSGSAWVYLPTLSRGLLQAGLLSLLKWSVLYLTFEALFLQESMRTLLVLRSLPSVWAQLNPNSLHSTQTSSLCAMSDRVLLTAPMDSILFPSVKDFGALMAATCS